MCSFFLLLHSEHLKSPNCIANVCAITLHPFVPLRLTSIHLLDLVKCDRLAKSDRLLKLVDRCTGCIDFTSTQHHLTHRTQLHPVSLSLSLSLSQELEGLRDGLIQCLYMVQTELTSRPPAEAVAEVQNSSVNEAEAVDRIMRINAPAMAAPASQSEDRSVETKELPVEQEIKLALGLLLKHRGGPGFGHGRLVGKELDMMAAKLR